MSITIKTFCLQRSIQAIINPITLPSSQAKWARETGGRGLDPIGLTQI